MGEPGPPATVTGAWPAVLELLGRAGVRTLFGLPADDVRLVGALDAATRPPRLIVCADQRAAVFMAVGHALGGGGPGVVVVGKGPATTNTATGLLEARASAAPVLVLAAGTPPARRGAGAFQELDQVATLRPLVTWADRVETPERLTPLLTRALRACTGPVGGPVYLEIPDHLLDAAIPTPPVRAVPEVAAGPVAADGPATRAVLSARRPIVLAGGGVRTAPPGTVEGLADALGAAVVVTASGRGAVDEHHPRFVGLSGLYAPPATHPLWACTDCVVALGTRLEETAVEGWPERIGTTVPVVQVNADGRELSVEVDGHPVVGDAHRVAAEWTRSAARGPARPDPDWTAEIAAARDRAVTDAGDARRPAAPGSPPTARDTLEALARLVPEDTVLVQENGLADMWTYHWPVWSCGSRGGSVVPSEQTPLGAGAAAAGGVKAAVGDRTVVAVVGDGALAMIAADLPSLHRAGLGVLYVVLDNGGYGWLEKQLDDGRGLFAVPGRAAAPEPGIPHTTVRDTDELPAVLGAALAAVARGEVVVVRIPVTLQDSPVHGAQMLGDTVAPAAGGGGAHG